MGGKKRVNEWQCFQESTEGAVTPGPASNVPPQSPKTKLNRKRERLLFLDDLINNNKFN